MSKVYTIQKKRRLPTWKMCDTCSNTIIYSVAYLKVYDSSSRRTKRTVVGRYCEVCKTFSPNNAIKEVKPIAV